MTRFLARTVMIALVSCLVPALGWAQSEKEGIALYKEAEHLRTNAHSKPDLEKALEKYEQAMSIFEKGRSEKWKGSTLNNIGAIYRSWGQYAKALEYYEQSLAIRRKLGDMKGEAVNLNNIGLVYKSWSQYEKALEYYEQSLAIRRKLGDIKGEGVTLNNMAVVYQDLGQPEKALEYYEQSLSIRRKMGDVRGEGVTLDNMGKVYRFRGQYEKALEYYEQSLAIRGKLGDIKGEGVTLNNMAVVYQAWGQYKKALRNYENALTIYQKLGDGKEEGVTLSNIGGVYQCWGQYRKALEYYEESLAIRRKLGDVKGEGITLNNIAGVYLAWAQYQKALECYEKALAIRRKIGDVTGEGEDLNSIGHVYRSWGQYQKALENYEKTLAITQKSGNVKGEGVTLNSIGDVYRSWGQYQKALEYYERSLAIRRKIGDVRGEGATLSRLGSVYRYWGQHERALENYQSALVLQNRIGVPIKGTKELIGNVYLDLGELDKAEPIIKEAGSPSSQGRLSLLKGNHQAAVHHYAKAFARAQKTRNVDSLFVSHTGLALGYEGLKNYESAADNFRQAIDLIEQMRDELNEAQRANFYDVPIGGFPRIAPYEGLSRVLIHLGRHQESFKLAEGTRARIFAELLSSRAQDASFDVPKTVVDQDADITNRLAALVQALNDSYEKGSGDAIQAFEEQVKVLRAERESHVGRLRKEYPLFAATKYPQPMDLQESALTKNEWVLEYEVTDSGVAIFLANGKQLVKVLFKPVLRKELDSLVRTFRGPFETTGGDITRENLAKFDFVSGRKLAEILLKDVLDELPHKAPVIIVPDDALGTLPFEALVLKDGGKINFDKPRPYVIETEFFGDRNPISYYQSVTALTLARTLGKQQKGGDRTLAMVDPIFEPGDARLAKAAAKERREILDRSTGDQLMSFKKELSLEIPRLPLTTQLGGSLKKADPEYTDVYQGMDAKKAVLLQKDLKPYRSLVFATHGYFGKDLPGIQEPVLILTLPGQPEGQDGFLRMTEVMGLKLNCEVAALTACQTGLGRHLSGEGTMGMGRAFQYAGAKSVLMSLWSVAETSSVNLVDSFFKHLREGKNKLEALRLARKEIRDQGYDHPFYWASFILVGEVN
jgi:tetratricopeptide (TPR) repeat protein